MTVDSAVLDDSTVMMMEQWGRWSRRSDDYRSLWYPGKTVEGKIQEEGLNAGVRNTRGGSSLVCDPDAEKVEEVVRNLSARDGLKARMIRLKWVWGWSGRKIAHEVGICKTDVYEQIDLAEMALQGMLWGGEVRKRNLG